MLFIVEVNHINDLTFNESFGNFIRIIDNLRKIDFNFSHENLSLHDSKSEDVSAQNIEILSNNEGNSSEAFQSLVSLLNSCKNFEALVKDYEKIQRSEKNIKDLRGILHKITSNFFKNYKTEPGHNKFSKYLQNISSFQLTLPHFPESLFKFLQSHLKITHSFLDFDSDTKDFLLSKKIELQGTLLPFSSLISNKSSRILDELPLNILIDDTMTYSIGKKLINNEKFYYDRRFVDTFMEKEFRQFFQYSTNVNPIKRFEDLLDQKVILLCDEPGMGKSTTLKQLQFDFKTFLPSSFVIYVDLKLHNSIYENFKDISEWSYEKFTQFFTQILNFNHFESKFFFVLLKSEQVIFLIDGVDELTKNHKDFMIKFTKDLYRITRCRLWIGMRPHCVCEYRGAFNILAYNLEPIDQNKFFEKFIKSMKIPEIEGKIIEKKIKSFLDFNKSSKNPLYYRIFLDVYEKLRFNVEIYTIYEKFIDTRFGKDMESQNDLKIREVLKKSKFFNENFKENTENSIIKCNYNLILRKHQQIAMTKFVKSILETKAFKNLIIRSLPLNDNEVIELSSYGIIHGTSFEDIFFIHQTFYEFFVANFFVQYIFEGTELNFDSDKLYFDMFLNILFNPNYQVIAKFIDLYVKINEEKILIRKNESLIVALRKHDGGINFLNQHDYFHASKFDTNIYQLVNLGHVNIVKLFLKLFSNESEIDEIFHRISSNDDTLFSLLLTKNLLKGNILDILKAFATSFSQERNKILFEYILFHTSYSTEFNLRPKIEPLILKNILKTLTKDDLLIFSEILAEIYTENELKLYLNYPNIKFPLDIDDCENAELEAESYSKISCDNSSNSNVSSNVSKEINLTNLATISMDENNKTNTDECTRNSANSEMNSLEFNRTKNIQEIQNQVSSEIISIYYRLLTKTSLNIIEYIADCELETSYRDFNTHFITFFEFFKKYLNIKTKCSVLELFLKKLNISRNFHGLIGVISKSKKHENRECLAHMDWKIAKTILNLILTIKDIKIVTRLYSIIETYLTDDEILSIIEKNIFIKNIFHNSCKNNAELNIEVFLKFSCIQGNLKKSYLTYIGSSETYPAISFMLTTKLSCLTDSIPNDEMKQLLNIVNNENETILFLIYKNKIFNEIFIDLLKRYFFKNEELKEYLRHRNAYGHTAFRVYGDYLSNMKMFLDNPIDVRNFIRDYFESDEEIYDMSE